MDSTYVHNLILGDTLTVECQLSEDSVPITGADVGVLIKRTSDDYYWGGGDWQVGVSGLTMVEYDSTNFPGYYTYSLIPSGVYTVIATVNHTFNGVVHYESHSWLIKDDQLQEIEDKVDVIQTSTDNLPSDPASDDITKALVKRLGDKVAAGIKYNDIT